MKQAQASSSSLLLLCCLFIINGGFSIVKGDLITDTCTKIAASDPSVQKDFCVQRLQYDQSTRDAKDINALSDSTIQLIQDKAVDVQSTITTLSSAPDPKVRQTLQECSDSYNDVVANAGGAHDSFKRHDSKTANVKLAAVLEDAHTCENAFKEGGLEVHPRLAIQTSKFAGLVKMGIAMTNMA
ncbi:hypothetical protein Sjap_004729 [Stephania japonica]|uniref:Pectinesterase inhibitor domain-containing protein n=1 Tax=Stephania japonica TaxID=461633 RepID=A0AAP0K2Q6_9MAGN